MGAINSQIKTSDVDLGEANLLEELKKLKAKPFVKIGLLGTSGEHTAKPGESAHMTVVDVAVANEFGTRSSLGNVQTPERSFIRSTFDTKESEVKNAIDEGHSLILQGKATVDNVLGRIGLLVQSLTRTSINEITDPPNAPETIKAKGSSKPLIDTGQMRNAVNFQTVMDGNDEGGDE